MGPQRSVSMTAGITGGVHRFGWTVEPWMALIIQRTIVKLLLEILLDSAKLFDRGADVGTVDDVDLHTLADSR